MRRLIWLSLLALAVSGLNGCRNGLGNVFDVW